MHLKVIANLSVDCKIFLKDYLPKLRQMCIDGEMTALFCVKNMSYELDETHAKNY